MNAQDTTKRQVVSCTLTFSDGTTQELDVADATPKPVTPLEKEITRIVLATIAKDKTAKSA